jgi:hypothetical protein
LSDIDPLLVALYREGSAELSVGSEWTAEVRGLAARCAPMLLFDEKEPFLPLTAGVTVFSQNGPSPSFPRVVTLHPDDGPPAALALEYAIWWDWDIHHLYELEHVWVYLDGSGAPVRLEASWHGKWYAHPIRLQSGRPVLFSEPGKHAFAPDPAWFRERQSKVARADTLAVRAPAGVLINDMFAGKIRQRVFDRTLARSYLVQKAFAPAWQFSRSFMLEEEMLVPWPVLKAWIPRRVNAILEDLESRLPPEAYRSLLVAQGGAGMAGLEAAAAWGADAVCARLELRSGRLMLGESGAGPDLEDVFHFLARQPAGLFLQVEDAAVLEPLAWFARSNEAAGMIAVLSADAGLLARYAAYVPGGLAAIQLGTPEQDPLQAADSARAAFVAPIWPGAFAPDGLADGWIRRVHAAGLGVIGGPVANRAGLERLQRAGVDVVLVEDAGWKALKEEKDG